VLVPRPQLNVQPSPLFQPMATVGFAGLSPVVWLVFRYVVITFGWPAADAIGRAGFDGAIDKHCPLPHAALAHPWVLAMVLAAS
jgi:hypothetical protein